MRIRKCVVCGSYTLKKIHCGKPTLSAHPPRFNINDKYLNLKVDLSLLEGKDGD